MGQVIGATNSKAEYPTERPLTPQDLLATVYRHLGIDPRARVQSISPAARSGSCTTASRSAS